MPDPNETVLEFDGPADFSPIYFELNSSALREAWKVAALAEYLKTSGKAALLSGFTSDEGTNEYNMALGARRAQAVRDYLEQAGVQAQRIGWVSYGEESLMTLDPNEKAKNRRVEIALMEDLK
jgi:peptidoglycan-associated lipoprotein